MATTHKTETPKSHDSGHAGEKSAGSGATIGKVLLFVGGAGLVTAIILYATRAHAATPNPQLAAMRARQAALTPPVTRSASNSAPAGHPSRRGLGAAQHDQIQELQRMLNATSGEPYCGGLTVDGTWGPNTDNAIYCLAYAKIIALNLDPNSVAAQQVANEADQLIQHLSPATFPNLYAWVSATQRTVLSAPLSPTANDPNLGPLNA